MIWQVVAYLATVVGCGGLAFLAGQWYFSRRER
jgi:hypothetical protein